MQGYSINGYLNAVLRRSDKTLLLEGTSDRSLINRLKLSLPLAATVRTKGHIDCVQMISDPSLATLGNKVRIGKVCAAAAGLNALNREKIAAKFGTLVDREWDGVDVDFGFPANWNPPVQSASGFTTLGHSIENYFFNISGAVAYLRQSFPDDISIEFLQDLETRFHQVIALAASYSLRLRDQNAISRAAGAICHKLVVWENDRYQLIAGLNDVLLARGIPLLADFHLAVNSGVDVYLENNKSPEPGRWLCHGHLGEQAIWSCIGSLAKEHGVNDDVASAIERGSHNNRQRHAADHLCSLTPQERLPLDEAVEWLTG